MKGRDKISDRSGLSILRDLDIDPELLFDSVDDGIYAVDKTGYFIYVNKIIEERSGIKLEDFKSLHFLDIILPEYHQMVKNNFDSVIMGHKVKPYELEYKTSIGAIQYVEVNTMPLYSSGNIIGLLGISRNITERKIFEKELIESKRLYSQLIETSPDPVVILQDGEYKLTNNTFYKVFGYSSEDVKNGLSFYRLVRGEDLPAVRERYEKRLAGEDVPKTFRIDLLAKDGKLIHCETSASLIEYNGRSADLVIIRDISERIEAEKAILESEERYWKMAKFAPVGIYQIDYIAGKFTYVNNVMTEYTGFSEEDLLSIDAVELLSEDSRKVYYERVGKIISGEVVPDTMEYRIRKKNGEQIWVMTSPKYIYDGENIKGAFVIAHNINKRKLAELALKENEKKYRLLAENVSDVIWTCDLNLKFNYISPSIFNLRGYTAEEVMKQTPGEILTPQSLEYVMNIYKQEMEKEKEGTPNPARSYTLEVDHIHKNGRIVPAEMIISGLRDSDNRLTGFLGVTRDITERKNAERALRESEQRYRSLVENIFVGLYIIDTSSWKFLYINQKVCDMLGYSQDEMLKLGIMDIIVPQEHEIVKKGAEDRISGKLRPYETSIYTIRRKDGGLLRVEVTASSVLFQEIHCLQGFIIDITEKEELQKQLLNSRKMESIGTLAGGIAHDFNNLLMGIQGNSSLMLLDVEEDSIYYEYLKNIQQHVRSGVELTTQLLGFARGGKYEVKPVNINYLINKSSRMFGRTHKEIKIYKKLSEDIWAVEVDLGQIEQVLLNIYVNAWQAMEQGGEIYIESENVVLNEDTRTSFEAEPGNYVKISIRDTGMGMDDETRQRVFDPFFTTKEMSRGTGLGLSSAYGIIKNHGGVITVSSKPGEGATFSIYIPATEKKVSRDEPRQETMLKGSETVLVIDDEEQILDLTRQILETLGYNVITAASGKEAIDIFRKEYKNIHLVIFDMIMPDMKGKETYRLLKNIDCNVKAILSTGYALNGEAENIMKIGCNGFVQKPFGIKYLSKKIREVLDHKD